MAENDINWGGGTWTPTFDTYGDITRSTPPMWRTSWYVSNESASNRIYFMNPGSVGGIMDLGAYPKPVDPDMRLPEGF